MDDDDTKDAAPASNAKPMTLGYRDIGKDANGHTIWEAVNPELQAEAERHFLALSKKWRDLGV